MPREYYEVVLGKSTFVIDKRYQNLSPIGRGAYGLVASADDTLTGRKVAIKRISRVFADLTDAKRILREVKLLRHFGHHDNLIDLLDIMTGPPETENFDTLYIVSTLFEADVHRIVQSKQALTDQHGVYFVYQILRGLKYIHSANVIHRDLKPSNLLVNSNCDLVICDFGLARGFSTETDGQLTEYVVTRWYRAPEVLCEAPTYGTGVDVWSVGCILAEVLGRQPLLRGNSTRDQLTLIIQTLGSPSDDDTAWITCKPALTLIKNLGYHKAINWTEMYPHANAMALDLLAKMLQFNPAKRISVNDALAHPYLAQLHARATEPVCSRPFDFTFEAPYGDKPMPMPDQQKFMWQEVVALRAQQKAEFARAGIHY